MSRRYSKINDLALVYRCWRCAISIYPSCLTFFGPGAALKCITCGPWRLEELKVARETFRASIVALGARAATEHRA